MDEQDIFAAGEAKIEQMRLRTDFSRFSDVWAKASGGGKVAWVDTASRYSLPLCFLLFALFLFVVVGNGMEAVGSIPLHTGLGGPGRCRFIGPPAE